MKVIGDLWRRGRRTGTAVRQANNTSFVVRKTIMTALHAAAIILPFLIYCVVLVTDKFVSYGAIVRTINQRNQNILDNFSYIFIHADHNTANSYVILAVVLKFYFFFSIICSLLTVAIQIYRKECIFRWNTKFAISGLAIFGLAFYMLFGPAFFGFHTSRGGIPPNLFGLFLISHFTIIPSLFAFSLFPLLPSDQRMVGV
ncbi:MAG: hypothetical protein JWR51_830 [Devosia sp.]|uniref:hypothetical protein n=1 Tax=Devosia sp. TaxID=1871048 RepID=UPI00261425B6|nr:hypothetical protein [Devosia sp.]MDB5527727.1 hypothetical protein [Devosia sp.]